MRLLALTALLVLAASCAAPKPEPQPEFVVYYLDGHKCVGVHICDCLESEKAIRECEAWAWDRSSRGPWTAPRQFPSRPGIR
jgi:hypothetical protein